MEKCKNCIHYGICPDERMYAVKAGFDFCFEDKSKFIKLPCSIGDYCIWHDDLWYVNGIGYFGDNDFLLWMSMADKSPCGAEAAASEVKFISEDEAKGIGGIIMRINPSPKCLNCINHSLVFYDGLYDCKLLGGHEMCILPQEPIEGLTPLGIYYDEYCIDNFMSGTGECKFYSEDGLEV